MRKAAVGIIVTGVAASLVLGACSSSKKTTGSSNTGGGSSSSSASASGKVGVILPDTTSSTRYTLYDAPLLKKAFDAAGVQSDIQNAQGDTSKFTQIAQNMIGEGVKVLLIDSPDAATGAGVEQKAKQAGVQVIDYDRVNLGGSAAYYVSFDNEGVGKLQGQTLVQCMQANKDPKGAGIIEMDGGTDVDNNAVLFAKGYNSVLDPLYSNGTYKKLGEAVVKGWTISNAAPAFTQALTSAGGKVDGVIAANDDIANAVITVLKSKNLNGVPVTGQDASIVGLQHILKGEQCMTVFKDVSKEADAASKLAIALIKGQDPSAAGVTLTDFQDPKGNRTLKAVLLTPEAITKANVKDVITAGALTAAQVCAGIQAQCTAAGIS
ncbi:MAG: D-xylose transport system substrate-binding protein [Pseudonocardiales bacterium]|jgi:D-xylose transport system substrate-binding protein|nr:D-xylose transport system substrate-binding protein [Pseudonocardiales bacterium]